MFERSELRSRREERMENGVKNLKGARLFSKTYVLNIATSYHGNGVACAGVINHVPAYNQVRSSGLPKRKKKNGCRTSKA